MSASINWSLNSNALKKQLLKLTKPKLIKICKSKNMQYTGNKNEIINRLLKPQKKQSKSKKTAKSTDNDKQQIHWQVWLDDEKEWINYNSNNTKIIEKAYQSKKNKCLIRVQSQTYEIRLKENPMKQFNISSTRIRNIQRIDLSNPNNYKFRYQKGYFVSKTKLNPIARILLIGVYDDKNSLSKFRGLRYLIQKIWEFTLSFNKHIWPKYINTKLTSFSIGRYAACFPEPSSYPIDINMMPFIMSDNFAETKLPKELESYFDCLISIVYLEDQTQKGKICYLTIQESFVDKNKTQRRPGLHVETPGKCGNILTIDIHNKLCNNGIGHSYEIDNDRWTQWGRGFYRYLYNAQTEFDGIYMLSSVNKSCVAWDCTIDSCAIGHLGDIENLRNSLRT
eukprot:35044_1